VPQHHDNKPTTSLIDLPQLISTPQKLVSRKIGNEEANGRFEIMSETSGCARLGRMMKIKSPLLRQFFAEFLGTFVLIMLGDGAIAQWKLTVIRGTLRGYNDMPIGWPL
jgi:ethanolamine utilization microcompartment shell protein EutS